jgi:hypothetical protein
MVSSASSGGVPSATAGTAVAGSAVAGTAAAGGIGLGTTAAVVGGAAVVAGGVALAASGSSSGSGGDDDIISEVANVSGYWNGTWTESGGSSSGRISLSLNQPKDVSQVNGTASITGSGCDLNGTVSGSVAQDKVVTLTIDSGDTQATFTASFGDPMRGTLAFTAGACRGDSTIADISKKGNATGGADVSW